MGLIPGILFPFIRFTNWKQENCKHCKDATFLSFHSYASRIGSKDSHTRNVFGVAFPFPFIRFTNWKQGHHPSEVYFYRPTFPFIRFTNWKQDGRCSHCPALWRRNRFHSYASRIGSKRCGPCMGTDTEFKFPFIRFTNWKQVYSTRQRHAEIHQGFHSYASRIGSKRMKDAEENPCFHSYASRIGSKKPVVDVYVSPGSADVSIHTLHELEARIIFHSLMVISQSRVSIHTLHELEASCLEKSKRWEKPKRFHSYASRIGSKFPRRKSWAVIP